MAEAIITVGLVLLAILYVWSWNKAYDHGVADTKRR